MTGLDACIAGTRCKPPAATDAGPAADAGVYVSEKCGEGATCRQSGLCVRQCFLGRGPAFHIVSRACRTDSDCVGAAKAQPTNPFAQKAARCVRAWRCDPDRKRGPADRTDPSTYLRERRMDDLPGLLITPAVVLVGLYLLGLMVTFAMMIRDRVRRRRS